MLMPLAVREDFLAALDPSTDRFTFQFFDATPDDYVMAAEDVAKIVVLMCSLPPEVNLYEATILPNHMRSFIGRG
jgi:NADP-dependent 3-hydroxy acid dehydrogenase YdfG